MAGRKQWASFERLNADDVNTYLADQSVMRFPTAAARDGAITAPKVGMLVTRDDNAGKPEYWDGVVWRLVSAGDPTPSALTRVDPLTNAVITLNTAGTTAGAWNTVSTGIARDVVIYSIGFKGDAGVMMEIGTGAAGAEVVRWRAKATSSSIFSTTLDPFGIFVPANTKIAFRTPSVNTTSASAQIQYADSRAVGAVNRVAEVRFPMPTSTAWSEVAATCPIATGGYVVACVTENTPMDTSLQFGVGAAGSEIAATGYLLPPHHNYGFGHLPPFYWPANKRLAARFSAPQSDTTLMFRAIVREDLT